MSDVGTQQKGYYENLISIPKRFHFNRTFGRYRHHRDSGGDFISGVRQSARKGAHSIVPVESQANRAIHREQIGLSIEQYKQDYDGMYPFARKQSSPSDYWYGAYLDPYIKSRQIVQCPSAPSNWIPSYGYNIAFGYFPGDQITPSRSGLYGTYCGKQHPMYDGISEAAVTEPSTSILMLDAALSYYYLRLTVSPPYSDASAATSSNAFFPQTSVTTMSNYYNHPEAGIHSSGVNCAYADGHAKWQKIENLLNPALYCAIK
jgi:prepilin-type processing-associated H-X9-DG protein